MGGDGGGGGAKAEGHGAVDLQVVDGTPWDSATARGGKNEGGIDDGLFTAEGDLCNELRRVLACEFAQCRKANRVFFYKGVVVSVFFNNDV